MVGWLSEQFERVVAWRDADAHQVLHVGGVIVATAGFVLAATLIVAYDSIFLGADNFAALQIGNVVTQDVRAPIDVAPFVSPVLTNQGQQEVRDQIPAIYFPPDPAISRQQADIAQSILTYIQQVRHDPYATPAQKLNDLTHLEGVPLPPLILEQILIMDDHTWQAVNDQVTTVLERVMSGEVRETNLPSVIANLPIQVSVRFTEDQSSVVVAMVQRLIRPNTLLNELATTTARDEAAQDVSVERSFERGQIVIRSGERLNEAGYEALSVLGLLEPTNRRLEAIVRAVMMSILILVVSGLYVTRFNPDLMRSSRFLALLGAVFLLILLGARLSTNYGEIYLYPTAMLALMYVALVSADIAVVGVLGMGVLVGIMQNNSLEVAALTVVGGMLAALMLRHPERLNGYFMPGLMVSLANVIVIAIFYQGNFALDTDTTLTARLLYGLVNGVLAAAGALILVFIVTLLFNLPTGIKLLELSQPNRPLLQRLLREAPGTYQHSLQVANLAEQAATAIGANADLVRVAALYHDVGKMENPAFFTENQVDGVNPHDGLDDPARSADIIISHVTEGVRIARQYRLPTRIIDFIQEHHGTQIVHFYQQAVARAGSEEAVDSEQFTYPGPKPQSRETAVLMLADSCEAAVRSRKPSKKQEIADTIQAIFDQKLKTGQLDESRLTLNDIRQIRRSFVEMLQAAFHPRIAYPTTVTPPQPVPAVSAPEDTKPAINRVEVSQLTAETRTESNPKPSASTTVVTTDTQPLLNGQKPHIQNREMPSIARLVEQADDDAPLLEVPPLPRTGEQKAVRATQNGTPAAPKENPEESQ
jgi:cyclic-di-AMP phosphodiesterase PgpH